MVRGLVEELRSVATNPGQLLTRINHDLRAILQQTGTPLFTTAFCLVADLEKREFVYANAGHPQPLLVRRQTQQVEPLSIRGKRDPALGLFQDITYSTASQPMRAGDKVILFTDGVYELEGVDNLQYNQEMLLAAVKKNSELACPDLFDRLLTEVTAFSADHNLIDDVCLVGVEVSPKLK